MGADGITTNPWTTGNGQQLRLNEDGAVQSPGSTTKIWNSAPTTTTFNVGGWDVVNRNGGTYVAYCFTNISGYVKVRTYTASGTSDFDVNVGFTPSFLLIKNYNTGNWAISDSARSPGTPPYFVYQNLYADTSGAQGSQSPPETNAYVGIEQTVLDLQQL